MQKILVGMSGGVDSSVAAVLLQQAGFECVGGTMKLYVAEGKCGILDDAADARAVAERLGMEHYVFDASQDFEKNVIQPFVSVYEQGGTPNPCIDCNRTMKFGSMYQMALELGCDRIATGHYARILQRSDGRWLLKKGLDENKDQSYFLYAMTQEMLSHTMFPVGELSKEQVRALAEEYGLINARKRDSQDICFVPDSNYESFIRRYTGKEYPVGDFVDENGRVLGRHKGIIGYTVGQRRGLGVPAKAPLYVCRKCVENNTVLLTENDALFSSELYANNINLIAMDCLSEPLRCKARIRYRHREQPATVSQVGEDTIKVVFDEAQRAITAGQAVVFYDGDTVIGGGTIL